MCNDARRHHEDRCRIDAGQALTSRPGTVHVAILPLGAITLLAVIGRCPILGAPDGREKATDMTVRPYEPRDRDLALALLKDPRAVDSPGHRIVVAEGTEGLALWLKPDAGEEGELASVLTPTGDRRLFYELAAAACRDAIDHGLTRGSFTIHDEQLLHRLQRDFRIDPTPSGWEPNTEHAVQWDVHVDLRDALQQLKEALDA